MLKAAFSHFRIVCVMLAFVALTGCSDLNRTQQKVLSGGAIGAGTGAAAAVLTGGCIGCGAAIGGLALDRLGLTSPLMISGALMLLTAVLVTAKVRIQ